MGIDGSTGERITAQITITIETLFTFAFKCKEKFCFFFVRNIVLVHLFFISNNSNVPFRYVTFSGRLDWSKVVFSSLRAFYLINIKLIVIRYLISHSTREMIRKP